ncbi:MAG TPA: branched-chain amino acid ABC transporter substrate-binding protein [Candidatus Limnocylindria bacterium]
MQKYLRWTAVLAVMLLVLAACGGGTSPSEEPSESAEASMGEDAAAVCAADPFGCVEIAAGDPIRIASALAIVGDVAFLGNDSNFGSEVAIDDRGQLFGRDIELVKEDAGCGEAEDGQTAAQAIVADPSIVGVIGTTCSRTAVPAMPVLADAGLVMISPSNTAPSLTNPDNADFGGPFYFRTAYNDQVQGAAVAQFVCDELPEATTAATIHDGSPYAEQLQQVFVDQFAEICGGTVTVQEAINIGDQDFSTVLTTIGADSPDILFFPIFSPEGPLVTRQSQDVAGLADTILIGADGLKDGAFVEAAGDLAEEIGMYFSGPDLNFGTAYTDDFLPKYLEKSGTEQPLAPYHAHGFDAANIFFDAIEAVGIEDADGTLWIPRDAVRQFVADLTDYPGLTGNLTCDEFGDCGSEFVSIAQLVDGVYTEVFTTRP